MQSQVSQGRNIVFYYNGLWIQIAGEHQRFDPITGTIITLLKLSMQRNPYGISSIGSLVIMVVLLSGVVGVSIPLMSGGLPRRQGDAQNSPTPAHSKTVASQARTPAALAEAAARSDGTVVRSSKSTPGVSTPAHNAASTPTATSTVLAQRPKALVRSADSFASVDMQQAATPSLTPSVVQPTSTASSTAAVVQLTQHRPFLQTRPHPLQPPLQHPPHVLRHVSNPYGAPRRQPTSVPQPTAHAG